MIFGWFRRMESFGRKVTWLVTLTSGAAIVFVSFALVAFDYVNLRREMLASLEAQTMIVAMNSGAPLAFSDQDNAAEALAAFQAHRAVALATLYDVNGGEFASYRRNTDVAPAKAAELPTSDLIQRWLRQVTAVEDQGQLLGRIEVVYDLRDLHQHLLRSLALATLVSLFAVGLVYLFSLRINQILVKPIAQLSRTARQVSETKDYTLRARKVSDDELGSFTDVFNQMLAQIQKQDIEIQASRAEALHASQLKDEFLATLSHELRTPMTPILGWAQILQRGARDNPQVLQAAEVIERNARAQNKIVDDLLEMSRIVSGKVRLDIERIDLAEVIESAMDTVAAAAQARGINLVRDLEPGAGLTRGDPHRLQQVVWNLLSNAIKFTGNGGRVGVTLRRTPTQIEIDVSDTGQGIAAAFLPHVFERFRQADSSNTRQHSGLGLGLAIVKQLVELHGGTVAVQSEGQDLGATFSVRLPVAAAGVATVRGSGTTPMPEPRRDATSADGKLAGLRVLLVDDESDARELVEHLLRNAGARVLAVESAAAALAAMVDFQPDALLSDIAMPGENGYELIRKIRALAPESGGRIPAIALTAFARSEDMQRALLAGFQMHLSKPVEQADLVAAVSGLVGGSAGNAV
jgi:signal transduction histidine kinase/ActR/RegA family two-component response regulator